jgi:DNA ligase-associated metallophosphoesterase
MDLSRIEIFPGVWLDHRRAVFLEQERILCVADLHLGYSWAHRFHGQMLPVHSADPLLSRLLDLCAFYKPKTFAFLGDIVHQAVPVTAIENEFSELIENLNTQCSVKLILGNHDRKLKELRCSKSITFIESLHAGNYLLVHGNQPAAGAEKESILMGHEHPAISLGDGVKSARFPCFLVSKNLLVLPAFSLWAAGSDVRCYEFMSPLARNARFDRAVAILGQKLLSVFLRQG